jgi:hypothetical protein
MRPLPPESRGAARQFCAATDAEGVTARRAGASDARGFICARGPGRTLRRRAAVRAPEVARERHGFLQGRRPSGALRGRSQLRARFRRGRARARPGGDIPSLSSASRHVPQSATEPWIPIWCKAIAST